MRVNVEFDIEGLDDIDVRQIIEDESLITPEINHGFRYLIVKNTVGDLIQLGAEAARFRVSGFKLIHFKENSK